MRKERNFGIDLLRIFCMHMIVLHHILDYCGISAGVELFSVNYSIVCLLHGVNHCAVNTYALITGYVYVDSNYKLSNIIKMWLQVLFYTVGFLAVFAVLAPETVDSKIILSSLFPMLSNHYWYFTQYVCMFFFIPVLNLILNNWNPREFKKFFLAVFLLFSCVNVIAYTNLFNVADGFSVVWLSVMYLIGGYIKKNPEHIKRNKKKYILIYTICVMITAASRWSIQFATAKILGVANNGGRLMVYTSPTMIFAAISLLIIFSELCVKRMQKWVQFLGPLTFSVYIIHNNLFLKKLYPALQGLSEPLLTANPFIFLGIILLITVGIYMGCSLIDFVRLKLFQFLQVGVFSEWAGKKLSAISDKVLDSLEL
ncbi:acyltransferase [Candidatus Merdisoma sp. JLR.KK006]|uniref:acyltransferase n=1 Tax=Candidatus Merdisoma sp. JLR.KK006 TaxID=3112626 RepID=UPI002FEF8775